jgi:putative transposase
MVTENPTWGAPRIHGELLMLDFDVSESTISRWMRRAPRHPKPGKRWLASLRNHRESIAAMAFFTVPTVAFNPSTNCSTVSSIDQSGYGTVFKL